MKMQFRAFAAFLLLITATVRSSSSASSPLQEVLARMDKAASSFRAMSAHVRYVTHTAILNQDDKESGTVVMRKVAPGEVQGLIEFIEPDARSVQFEKRSLRIYYPKINKV